MGGKDEKKGGDLEEKMKGREEGEREEKTTDEMKGQTSRNLTQVSCQWERKGDRK